MPSGGPDARGDLPLRYEDVTQTGQLVLEALPTAVGTVTWQRLFADLGERGQQPSDVIPILTRLVIHSLGGPLSVGPSLSGKGTYALAHSRGADGEIERLFLNMWVELTGIIGNTHGFWVEGAGDPVVAGRVFAEHVFTRPFAPPEGRKVTSLSSPNFPAVPPDAYDWRSPETVLSDVPADTEWLDADYVADPLPLVFSVMHTDSNQHVNSLVYPRVFEEAAIRRLHAHGITKSFARYAELVFRKPCFAGEVIHLHLQAARSVVRGYFAAPGEPRHKARAFVRLCQ